MTLPPMTVKLGILLSGGGTTYANLETAIREGRLPADIAVVVSSKAGVGGIDFALKHSRPLVIAANSAEVTSALRDHGVQWVVMCGWLKYWDPPEPWRGRTINIHPSLLPAHGGKGMYGLRVHQAVVAAGEKTTGCTVHLVSGAYDSGSVLAQVKVPVKPGDTAETLQDRVMAAERALYPQIIAETIARLGSEKKKP